MNFAHLLASILLLAVVGVCADNQVLTASTTLNAVQAPSPAGSIALTSVSDALSQPRDSPLMTKNTFAIGNNVVITKSNIIIRKEADGSSESAPSTTKISPLARVIEGVVARSTAETVNASCDAVLDMLGMAPSSSSFASIRSQVMALFQARGDHQALRKRVAMLLDTVNQISESEGLSHSGKDDDDNDDKGKDRDKDDDSKQRQEQQLIGYRTLFRWSAGARPYYGWRYPLRYWVLYGSSRFDGACGLGRVIGDYFYC